MRFHKNLTALLLVLPLAVLPAACGDKKDDRDAAQNADLDRDLNLALKGDSTQGIFEDTTQGMAPSNEGTVQPAPTPTPTRRRPNPTPSPAPVRRTTDRTPAPAPVSRERTVTSTAPAGSTFAVTFDQTISTQSNSAGDAFTATLQDPIMDTDGNVLVPAGATVHGHITRVAKSGDITKSAVISLAFDRVTWGSGRSAPLDASVLEVHPEKHTRQTTAQQAGKVAAGAAAGAVLGKVLGKSTKGAIKGAVIGAAAGTAVAMGTADVDAVLPAGSTMRVKLDGPITVRRTVS